MKTPTLILSMLILLFSFVVKAQDKSTLELKGYGDVYCGFTPTIAFQDSRHTQQVLLETR